MADELRAALAPAYPYVKALHLLAVMAWAWSTAVAWVFYLKPAFRRSRARPDDEAARAERDRMMERFDRGAGIEHVAFPLVLATGLYLWWVAGFRIDSWSWFSAKLLIVAVIFIPMELVDVYLSHLGGNKARIRKSGDRERYERFMEHHWRFFRVTEPLVMVIIPLVIVLAVARPF